MPQLRRRALLLSSIVMSCAAAPGCSDDPAAAPGGGAAAPADEPDVIEATPFASTRRLGDADVAVLETASEDGTLTFSSEPPALAGVEVGQVLLAPMSAKAPRGLLRVVTGVERGTSSGVVVRSAAAPLQVAFKKLHARLRRKVDVSDPAAPFAVTDTSPLGLRPLFSVATGRGEREQSYQIVVFDGDGDVATKNDQIAIDATLGGGFDYRLSVDVDWGAVDELPKIVSDCLASIAKIAVGQKPSCSIEDLVPEAKTTFDVDPFVTIDVNASGAAALEFEKSLEVGTINLPPFALGPLVLVPTVDVVAKVAGSASAHFDVGAKASANVTSSVTLSSKTPGAPQYTPPTLKDYKVEPRPPTVDLHASATASVGARLNVSVFGVAGPYATASGVAEISAAPLEDPCWKLRFAIEAELGARITSPRLPVIGYVTLADFHAQPFRPIDEEVARGSCVVPPDPPPAPGKGPSARTYQSPTFAPWAKRLGGAVDGSFSATGTFRLGSPELVPSIDGRWIAAGPFAFGLHKIDGDGTLTWTSALGVPAAEHALRSLRSVPMRDAALLELVEPPDTAAFILAKTSQSGALEWAKSYALPAECITRRDHLVRDTGAGFIVLGHCASGEGWLVHVDEAGDVLRARTLRETGSTSVEPSLGTTSDGAVVIAGEVMRPSELEWTFVTRLDEDDRPTSSSTAFHCPERISMQPATMIPSENGGVTVVGEANGPGYVARVRKDGALGFVRFPNIGLGVASGFIVSSVAELATTGMVFAGSMRNVSTDDSPAVIVAGADSGGRTLWSRRYALGAPAPRALAIPALALTDDGGVLVTAVAGTEGGGDGDLFAMKVFAKDGTLGEGTPITSTAVTLDDYVCTMETRPFAPQMTDVAVTTSPVALQRR